MNTNLIMRLSIGFFVLMLISAIVIYKAKESQSDLPVYAEVTPFAMTERSGEAFTNEQFKGHITVVNFFFATCAGPCPAMNARVAELYRAFAGNNPVRFVSVTIDPDRDSLVALRNYASSFNVNDNRWSFLRGDLKSVEHLSENIFMVGSGAPTLHSTKLILVDHLGRIRGYYSSEEPASLTILKTHIRELVREMPS